MKSETGTLPTEWVPSKGRVLESLQIMAAAQEQPSGKALPQLITREISTPEMHMEAAKRIDPFKIALENALPQQFKHSAYMCTWEQKYVIQQRLWVVSQLKDVSKGLEKNREKWKGALPEGSPARQLNLPLIHILCKTLDYPDVHFTRDLALGMPIVGSIPSTQVLQPRERKATMEFDQWKEGMYERNKKVLERAKKYQEDELVSQCWDKTLGERGQFSIIILYTNCILFFL